MVRRFLLLFIFSFTLLPAAGVFAQYPFGKNKVVYAKKNWKVLQTTHVDIYHYPSERNLVVSIAPAAEETYKEFCELFNMEFENPVPVVLFSSHYDFQQTNIIPYLISESTGGFTDLMKGRIAIPFTGSYSDLLHVLRHEMVHAFMLEKIRLVMSAHGRFNYHYPPLWFIEGMAEYIASSGGNTQSDMYIRDALMHGRLLGLDDLWRIEGSYMMYKHGEAVIRYIATNFGREAITKIFDNWWIGTRFSMVLKYTLNMDVAELNDAFTRSIKRRHYPAILSASFAPDVGVQLSRPRSFHARPAAGPAENGDYQVYSLCAELGVINICSMSPAANGEIIHRTKIKGGRRPDIESIPVFRSKMEVLGDTLLFVAKQNGRDALVLWDLEKNKRIRSATFEHLSMISSPTMSPDRTSAAFSAIDTTGMLDLYLFDFTSESLRRLTRDYYIEEDADFHPSKDVILFASDRRAGSNAQRKAIFFLDLTDGSIEPLTSGEHRDSHPEWSPDGTSFLFSSDRDGTPNIYLFQDGVVTKQTDVLGGVFTPSFTPDGEAFLAGGYYNSEFHIFEFPVKKGPTRAEAAAAAVDSSMNTMRSTENFAFTTKDYRMKLGLDFIGAGIAVDPNFGELGNGGQLLFTDILGNHQFYVFFANSSEGFDDFWRRLSGGVTYVNLSHRLNYSLGVFHLASYFSNFFTLYRSERRYGVSAGASYPFSKFSRLDASIVLRKIERETEFASVSLNLTKSTLGSTFLTYASDNTLWTIGGPLTGTRYYITGGNTIDFEGKGFESTSLILDTRKYFKITRRILLAERFVTRNSWGGDLQLFYLGGPWDLRGYDFREFVGRSTYLLNSELRFPLVDRLNLYLPFGTIEFPMLRGSLFFDVGKTDRYVLDTEWLGSFGAGVELNLGFAPVIRLNFTRITDFSIISDNTEVELFIGLNY